MSSSGSIVFPEQADQALLSALVSTAMALFDVYVCWSAWPDGFEVGSIVAVQ